MQIKTLIFLLRVEAQMLQNFTVEFYRMMLMIENFLLVCHKSQFQSTFISISYKQKVFYFTTFVFKGSNYTII